MRLSITQKVTIWFSVILLIMSVSFILVMTTFGNNNAKTAAKARVLEVVSNVSDDVTFANGEVDVNEDIELYSDGVFICFYDADEKRLKGTSPLKRYEEPALIDRSMRKVRATDNQIWYIYDLNVERLNGSFWIRGIVEDFSDESTFTQMMKFMGVAIPILVLVAIIGGLIITRGAFAPVRGIIKTVEQITEDGDLSRRVEAGNGRDELSQLSKSFNEMFSKLEESQKEEKRITSDISHELRTPLTVIMAQSEYALTDEDYRQEALTSIHAEASRMSALVNEILIIARGDAGKIQMDKEEVNLSELVSSIADQQELFVEEKRMTLRRNIEEGVSVMGDQTMLIRIVLNLLSNAVKYGKSPGGIIDIGLCRADGYAEIKVRDDGKGIDEESLKHVWDRFYQVDGSRSDSGSSGLGLAIVKALATAHGGEVDAKSELGKFTEFIVRIPLLG